MPFRYPVALELTDRPCVVVGGGALAAHKARELLEAGARVTMISPAFSTEIEELEEAGAVSLLRRAYETGDLAGVFLAVAATDDGGVNASVFSEGDQLGVLVNSVDDVAHCHFAAPSVIRRGDLMVTISTGGKAPALAKRLRIELSEQIGEEYGTLVSLLGDVRGEMLGVRHRLDFETWAARWQRALEPDLVGLVRRGEIGAVRDLVRSRLRGEGVLQSAAGDGAAEAPSTDRAAIGSVALVGAGPGDPSLITVRGRALLDAADVVVHDRLVHPDLYAGKTAVYAGKHGGSVSTSQEDINSLLVRLASRGRRVVRLKGGDPFLFGRGAEEAEALSRAGIPFEVVPAPTSALAALAYAGIPVTDRRASSSVAIVSGHADRTEAEWRSLVDGVDTIVVLMGMSRLRSIVSWLLAGGADPDTPAAVVENGTLASQRVVTASLEGLADAVIEEALGSPAVIVVGDVVRLRQEVSWFEPDARTISMRG
jgi:uroporphyrin-III C-methyltransferase/precorrin-2 dehydrogenase/sirohydrochlorin ferrochelatase